LAEAAAAGPAQPRRLVRLEAGHFGRQLLERASAARGAPQCRARGRGESDRGFEAELGEAGAQPRLQAPDAAIEAQAALDLRRQAVRRLERDLGREWPDPRS